MVSICIGEHGLGGREVSPEVRVLRRQEDRWGTCLLNGHPRRARPARVYAARRRHWGACGRAIFLLGEEEVSERDLGLFFQLSLHRRPLCPARLDDSSTQRECPIRPVPAGFAAEKMIVENAVNLVPLTQPDHLDVGKGTHTSTYL